MQECVETYRDDLIDPILCDGAAVRIVPSLS
jgi:hypothetical protein